MKATRISEIMDLAFKARRNGNIFNPCFVGAPGVGKTEVVETYCVENNIPHITLTSAVLEPPDVRGFPVITNESGKQRMTFVSPDFWPDSDSEEAGVIILEELNRGTNAIMNAWMSLTDTRRGFDNYKLPKNYIVVGCINPEDGVHDVQTMDSALKDRFEMFTVEFDKMALLDYAKASSWNEWVTMFLEAGLWEYKLPENIGNVAGSKYLSGRTWSKASAALNAGLSGELEPIVLDAILGGNYGRAFYSFKTNDTPVLMSDIRNSLKKACKKLEKFSNPKDYKNGHISLTISSIVDACADKTHTITNDELAQVLESMPADQGARLVREIDYKRNTNGLLTRMCDDYPAIKKMFRTVLKDKA